jgi:ABC-type multidrug transport system fused ATPase/permease subunit
MLLMAFPFMFLGGITDFLFPDLISNVVDAMSAKDQDEVVYRLKMWLVIIVIGAVSTGLNSILFGITSERLGKSLRNKLFQSLIYKDTSFYDESRVGDLCKLPFAITILCA